MDFLSTGTWWAFFLLEVVLFIFQKYYKPRQGMPLSKWRVISYSAKLLLVLIVFFVFGWKGGIGLMVALFLLENLVEISAGVVRLKKQSEID